MNIANKIYTVRGRKVMLDADLAEIYGYSTKAFNQQVARNPEKFKGEDFMFRLTREELKEISRSQFVTLKKDGRGSNVKYLPYAFTEQGIYMLMTVLKGPLATKQSRILVMLFKAMKDYIIDNQALLKDREELKYKNKIIDGAERIIKTERKVAEIDAKLNRITDEISDVVKKSELSPVLLDFDRATEIKEFLLLDGEPIKAKEAYMNIYKQAKKEIYIIDNYIDITTLHLLQISKKNLKIVVFTDNVRNLLRKSDLDDFKIERPDLDIIFTKTGRKIHDRFIIIDNSTVYQSGGSSKDAGRKISTIHQISDDFARQSLLNEIEKLKRNGLLKLK